MLAVSTLLLSSATLALPLTALLRANAPPWRGNSQLDAAGSTDAFQMSNEVPRARMPEASLALPYGHHRFTLGVAYLNRQQLGILRVYVTWSGVRDVVGHLHATCIFSIISAGVHDVVGQLHATSIFSIFFSGELRPLFSSSAPRSTNLIVHCYCVGACEHIACPIRGTGQCCCVMQGRRGIGATDGCGAADSSSHV